MKSDEGSQATGSKQGLLPKADETMKMVGSSKDTAKGLMKAADGTPVPHDDDEEFEDGRASKVERRKVSGKALVKISMKSLMEKQEMIDEESEEKRILFRPRP